MPKDPHKKRVEVHLSPADFKLLEAHAKENYWSLKKTAEIAVMKYLASLKKRK
jgi:hypothetical protein